MGLLYHSLGIFDEGDFMVSLPVIIIISTPYTVHKYVSV